jgi:NADH:ubiquinone oxidoreductase subunit 4 (subunit M)
MTFSPSSLTLAGAAFFLPLFPQSMVYTLLMRAMPWGGRVVLTLVWPQIGLALVSSSTLPADPGLLQGLLWWGLATALFYAWRLLATRELAYWSAFYAVSAWALGWVGVVAGAHLVDMQIALACCSLVAAALMLASHALARRWGDAYLGLRSGLGRQLPRTGGLVLLALLGVVAVPGFPSFFALLYWLSLPGASGAGGVGVLLVWLVWGWAAFEAWRQLAYGDDSRSRATRQPVVPDLATTTVVAGLAALLACGALAGFWSMTEWMK